MRVPLVYVLLPTLFGLAGMSAAQSPEHPHDSKPSFSITISAPQSTVKVGSPLMINALKTNKSDHGIPVVTTLGSDIKFDVRDALGILRPKVQSNLKAHSGDNNPFPGIISFVQFTINPGKTIAGRIDLRKEYDLDRPGQCTIQAEEWDTWSDSLVKSNAITVTLTNAPQVTESPEGEKTSFTLSISTTEDIINVGSEVFVALEVTNTSDRLSFYDPSITKLDPQVRDSQGNTAPLTQAGRDLRRIYGAGGSHAFGINPGDTMSGGRIIVSKIYDMTRPGKYTIQVSRVDEESKVIVKSNIITVTVVP